MRHDLSATHQAQASVHGAFVRRVLTRQISVGTITYLIVALLAPWSLLLESPRLSQLWLMCLAAGVFAVVVTAVTSMSRLKDTRKVFLELAFEPEKVEAEDIGALAHLPVALTWRFTIAGLVSAALMLVPTVRPAMLDDARAVSLALLTFTIVSASAVVHFVTVRDATIRAIELSPLEPISAWLEHESLRMLPERRVSRRILIAVVAPVVLVGVGAVLVTHAHLRAFVERGRFDTAVSAARIALDEIPGAADEGKDDALGAAMAHGFAIRPGVAPVDPDDEVITRLPTGQLEGAVDLGEGRADVVFSAQLTRGVVTTGILVGLGAILLAVIFGTLFGRMLAADLVLATQQVGSLGTATVLEGKARVAGPARFAAVAELGRSVEALAERFRVFAAAQERALIAKENAQRMKQLLFASVSHDLKSPLNAILGFAELVREEPLTKAQIESLDMVSGRGRELLALIETILDAARVEAGQLSLIRQPVSARELINEACAKAKDLRGSLDVVVELVQSAPDLRVDPTHMPRAIAVLIAHAIESATGTGGTNHGRAIRVRMSLPEGEQKGEPMARLHIEYLAASNRPSLLEAQLRGQIPRTSGRGMVLRLALARAIIELHGGKVEVGRGPHGAAVVTAWVPLAGAGYEYLEIDAFDTAKTLVMRRK